MITLSAFADEISPDLDVQIRNLKKNDVTHIELRGVWSKNVLALTEDEVRSAKEQAADRGIGFSAVGSPLGKFRLDEDFASQMDDLKKALDYAALLEAPYIRMFSFYPPEGEMITDHRSQVLDWLGQMVAEAEKTDIILAHENEKGIYGDTGERCLDLYTSIDSPAFTGIFDFANFVQCGEHPYEDCWTKIKPYISYFHIKDALMATGAVVPAGHGDGDIEQILIDAVSGGFDGFLSLEPHLSLAEASYGRTSPDLFTTAVDALKAILSKIEK